MIKKITIEDKRFPLENGAGSDAIHINPTYSYAITMLIDDSGITGTGFAFTLGQGNELVCSAAKFYAEQLIGKGDMLISHHGEVTRLQCVFIDTPEVERIVEFIGEQRGYPQAFLLPEYIDEKEMEGKDFDLSDRDSLFDDAARLIVQSQSGSTSLLQRRMKLGYNRAGRLMDQLEAAGIVGPNQGSKVRDVLIKTEADLQQQLSMLG